MKVVFAGARPLDYEDLQRRLPGAELVVEPTALVEALSNADAVVCYRLSPEDTRRATRLRLVQTLSAGADGIAPGAVPQGAVLCNVRGHERTIAEWVLMALLALPRHVVQLDRALRAGRWHRYGDERLDVGEPELDGKTVALVGYGQIGRAVEALVTPLGAYVVAVTRRPRDGVLPLEQLSDALSVADFAVVSLPAQAGTVIAASELEALGSAGYLVNVGRGSVVDEHALYTSLHDRRIAGAAIDVWYRYPEREGDVVHPSRHPFQDLDNVLMSPHASGRSHRARLLRWQFVAEQLERLARGEPLENVVAID